MAVVRAQVTMERATALPVDAIVNTLHYQLFSTSTGLPVADFVNATQANDLAIAINAVWRGRMASLFGAHLSGITRVDIYDMADPEPRVPIGSDAPVTTATVGGTKLPGEVAICVSFQAPKTSGVPQARRRGRLFLGPLATSAMDTTPVGDVQVASAWRTSALALINELTPLSGGAGLEFRLGVLSRASMAQGATPDDAFVDVTQAWVDNAFDTQRRRGKAAVSRVTQTIA